MEGRVLHVVCSLLSMPARPLWPLVAFVCKKGEIIENPDVNCVLGAALRFQDVAGRVAYADMFDLSRRERYKQVWD